MVVDRPWKFVKNQTTKEGNQYIMGRGKIRLRPVAVPAISTLTLIFGSALIALAVLSLISVRTLDRETILEQFVTPPYMSQGPVEPTEKQADFLAQYANQTFGPVEELQQLQAVPKQWDVGRPYIWEAENAEWYYGCSEPSYKFPSGPNLKPNGYLYIEASGGLNQQRTGITDAVVVAKILNATLVVPHLDHKSYWKDKSNFSDIFDEDWFISSVAKDVKVIKEPDVKNSVYTMRVPRKVKPIYYLSKILPILQKRRAVLLTRFDYRLSNKLTTDWQKLRCRTNYKALRFTKSIQDMGQMLVDRMRAKSGGRFIALHLRYEPDMLAFSGCYYGGGLRELEELGKLRKRWKTLHAHDPARARRNGKCPLTPKEVGLMLRALGYGNDTYLYVASGEVYNGIESLAPLKALFPNYVTKDTLTKRKELREFRKFSSRMAAIDYIVCSQSDVFVTNNNGNMARILAGERRYHGHKRTIRPNVKKLNHLFPVFHSMPWVEFATGVRKYQKGFMGDPNEVKIGRGEFHEHPLVCICAKPGAPPAPPIKMPRDKLGLSAGDGGIVKRDDEITGHESSEVEDTSETPEEEEDDLPMMIENEQSGGGSEQDPDVDNSDGGKINDLGDVNGDGTYD